MNKFQAEKRVYAFHANDAKPFQNPTGRSPFDHFLDPQSMTGLFKTLNRWFLLILFQQIYYGGQADYTHTKMIT